ncbi:hypothetical protein F5Y16DRAFT_234940 [Xylariaceae sp. FL0255]|nr:hypothetical protein F5Y16DRAFT_234940 [Xylariaceae sp. FL0255]
MDDEFSFKCAAWSVHNNDKAGIKIKEAKEEKDEMLRVYQATIRYQLNIPGEMTFYVGAKWPGDQYHMVKKITDLTQTLWAAVGHDRLLIVRYDERKTVAAGGAGGGANATTKSKHGVLAEGGMGTGGRIDARGNARGGTGLGGGARGEDVTGDAGDGMGGNANTTRAGARGKSGKGVAGDVTQTRYK